MEEEKEDLINSIPDSDGSMGDTEVKGNEAPADAVEKKPKRGRPNKSAKKLNSDVLQDAMFWYYVSLGNDRSLEKVAEHFNVELWIVKEASRTGGWTQRVKELGSSDDLTANEIVKYADAIQVSVLNEIINNPDTKPSDKIKALNALNEFVAKSSALVHKKKIVIEFKNREALEKIVEGIRDGSIYRDVGLKNSTFMSILPDDYEKGDD